MDTLLKHFKHAAQQGSISVASSQLGVSQPAISKSIKRLESRYNTPLLIRQARGVMLTQAGQIVLDRIQRIEKEMSAIEYEINALHRQQTILRIGAGSAWEKPISSFLPNFYLKHPKIRIEVQSNTICKLIPPLLNDEIELAFGGEDGESLVNNNALTFTPIMQNRMCIVANKNHPLAQGQECNLEILSQYPWVAFQHSKVMLDHLNRKLDMLGLDPVEFIMQTEFIKMALAMVERSDALMCISDRQIDMLGRSGVIELNTPEPIWHYHLGVWSKTPKYRSQIAQEFLDEVIKHI